MLTSLKKYLALISSTEYQCLMCGKTFEAGSQFEHDIVKHLQTHLIVTSASSEHEKKTSRKIKSEQEKYISNFLNSKNKFINGGDISISCNNGNLKTYKLLLASISQMLYEIFKENSEVTNIFLPDVSTELLSRWLDNVYINKEINKYHELNIMLGILDTKGPDDAMAEDVALSEHFEMDEYEENEGIDEDGVKNDRNPYQNTNELFVNNESGQNEMIVKKSEFEKSLSHTTLHFKENPETKELTCIECGKVMRKNKQNNKILSRHLLRCSSNKYCLICKNKRDKRRNCRKCGEDLPEDIETGNFTSSVHKEFFPILLTNPYTAKKVEGRKCKLCPHVLPNYNAFSLKKHLCKSHIEVHEKVERTDQENRLMKILEKHVCGNMDKDPSELYIADDVNLEEIYDPLYKVENSDETYDNFQTIDLELEPNLEIGKNYVMDEFKGEDTKIDIDGMTDFDRSISHSRIHFKENKETKTFSCLECGKVINKSLYHHLRVCVANHNCSICKKRRERSKICKRCGEELTETEIIRLKLGSSAVHEEFTPTKVYNKRVGKEVEGRKCKHCSAILATRTSTNLKKHLEQHTEVYNRVELIDKETREKMVLKVNKNDHVCSKQESF